MKKQSGRSIIHFFAAFGAICTGLLYASIGVIAILSFLKLKKGGADEGSFLVYLDQYIIGKVFIFLILLGMLSYIAWRIYETVKDPYEYGNDFKGILRRSGTAFSGLADAMIAWSAIQALWVESAVNKQGLPTAERELTASLLAKDSGSTIIIISGSLVCLIAVIQAVYVVSGSYRERINIGGLKTWKKNATVILAWTGHFARGIILFIMGFFLLKAGIGNNANLVVNTDKAFDFIGDNIGHPWFILVAAGTICYGVFMILFGAYFDSDA